MRSLRWLPLLLLLSGVAQGATTLQKLDGTTTPMVGNNGDLTHYPVALLIGMKSGVPTMLTLDSSGNLNVSLAAGSLVLGKVGIDQTTPGTTNGVQVNAGEAHLGEVGGNLLGTSDTFSARPANTTAYAANQNWNISLSVTAVTNASPPVATIGAHTLVAGDFVTIAGIVGATGANGTWKLGTVTGTTVTLLNADGTSPSAPGVWSSGGTVAQLLVFHVGRIANGTGYITKARLTLNSTTTANGSFKLYLYGSSTVTAQVDQAAYQLLWANRTLRIGYISFSLFTEGAGSDSAIDIQTNLNIPFTSDANGNIYARLAPQLAYVPTSGEQAFVEITADRN